MNKYRNYHLQLQQVLLAQKAASRKFKKKSHRAVPSHNYLFVTIRKESRVLKKATPSTYLKTTIKQDSK